MQMLENPQSHRTNRALSNPGKHNFTQFSKHSHGQTQQAICEQDAYWKHENRLGVAKSNAHLVDQLLEYERNAHPRNLRADQKEQRKKNTPLVYPKIGKERLERSPVVARTSGGGGTGVGATSHMNMIYS